MGTQHREVQEWKTLIRQYEDSGLTIKDFCSRRRVSYWSFCRWRRTLSESTAGTEVVEVAPLVPPTGRPGFLRVTVGSVTIEVGTPVDEPNLVAVLRAVERSRC